MRKPTQFLGLVGALCVALPAATSLAEFRICNATEEQLFVMWVAPFSPCPTRHESSLALIAPSGCTLLDSSPSSQGKTFYYNAWSRSGADEWRGNTPLWLPKEQLDRCMPPSTCGFVPDASECRRTGKIYNMRSVTATAPNSSISLRYEPAFPGGGPLL